MDVIRRYFNFSKMQCIKYMNNLYIRYRVTRNTANGHPNCILVISQDNWKLDSTERPRCKGINIS